MNAATVEKLQQRIYAGFPPSRAMDFLVAARAGRWITIAAPLDRNTKGHGNCFE